MALHNGAAEQIAAAKERQGGAYLHGRAPLPGSGFGAYTIGDMALIEPGCSVFAREEGPNMRVDADLNARGGIVLEVTVTPTVDQDTGEMFTRRAFRCYDPLQQLHEAFRTLTEAQIDLDRCEAPDLATLRRAYRRFCREVGHATGVATLRELGLVTDAARLAALVGQSHP